MKINNDRSYRRGFRIAIPLVLSVLAYDLVKATLAGSLRESSLTLKILGVLKTQMVSFLHFVSSTLWPQFVSAWAEWDAYLFLLLGTMAAIHIMRGPFYVALEINDEVVLLENRWFKFIRRDHPGWFETQRMIPSQELRYVYMKKWLFMRFLCLDFLYQGEERSLKFNVSRLNSEQRKKTVSKLRAVMHAYQVNEDKHKPVSETVSQESMSKRSVLWKKVG